MSSFQLESTSAWADIRDVIFSIEKPIRFEYRGMLHTEKEDIPILKLISIDTIRDYVNNIGDHIQIEFKMLLGEYATRLYPFRDNLEFTIKRIELQEATSTKKPNSKIITERFKAVFLVSVNPVIAASELEMHDAESLNKVEQVDVKLQLLDRSLEPLRIKTCNGIFKQVTQKQIINNIMIGESAKVLVDGKPSVDGLDMVPPDNVEVKNHVIIPTGTLMTGIPTYLQEKMGGVYNAGIGTYLQTYDTRILTQVPEGDYTEDMKVPPKLKFWFVYPLFDITRFDDKEGNKVIFYAIPQEKFPQADKTYYNNGLITTIVVTANKKYQDSADSDYMNHGVGFRMQDARTYMNKPVELTPDGPKAVRVKLNHENAIKDRKDGLNYAPFASYGSSSNPFREYSKIIAREVSRVDLVWENADITIIKPGMPCKYVFILQGKVVELKGIVLFVHGLTSLQGNSITNNTYKTVCQLTLVVEKYKSEPKTPSPNALGEF